MGKTQWEMMMEKDQSATRMEDDQRVVYGVGGSQVERRAYRRAIDCDTARDGESGQYGEARWWRGRTDSFAMGARAG